MIELRLHPPFTAADLAGFARLAASFDPDAARSGAAGAL